MGLRSNCRFTRTPILAKASPFSWPVLVPSALRVPAPVTSTLGLAASTTNHDQIKEFKWI